MYHIDIETTRGHWRHIEIPTNEAAGQCMAAFIEQGWCSMNFHDETGEKIAIVRKNPYADDDPVIMGIKRGEKT